MSEENRSRLPLSRREFAETLLKAAGWLAFPVAGCTDLRQVPTADAAQQPDFEVIVLSDIMVPMRDGVRLATDAYVPGRDGRPVEQRFPVILERTPYDKTADSRSERTPAIEKPKSRVEVAAFFVRRGYVVIYQDCRGRYKSEGLYVKYLSDGVDGYDTCAWVVNQVWSDGAMVTIGLSYAAHALGGMRSDGV